MNPETISAWRLVAKTTNPMIRELGLELITMVNGSINHVHVMDLL
jgi:hypothetical protein